MPDTPFALLLRERMAAAGLNDRKVSEALATAGVKRSPSAVSAWRRGVAPPPGDIQGAIAAVIGSDVVTVALACAGQVVAPGKGW